VERSPDSRLRGNDGIQHDGFLMGESGPSNDWMHAGALSACRAGDSRRQIWQNARMSSPQESVVIRLLAQARGGDTAARDELFARCRSYVNLVARAQVESWMRTRTDASDLVQQTLLEAHCGFDEFRGQTEAEWLAWLKKILSHNVHDFVRTQKADKRDVRKEARLQTTGADGESFQFEPSGDEPTPSAILVGLEEQLELADAIAQLPEDYQQIILLRNLQRLPFDEIALRMDRSRPAAQMLWTRAIKKLEEVLQYRRSAPM
jgi:RNA polymerase sigma-70 factor, ECF subfamily